MTTLSLDRIVQVKAELAPPAAPARNFDRAMFLYAGESSIARHLLDDRNRDRRINSFTNLAAVAADYDTTHPAYLAARAYFAQVPMPHQFLTAGWFMTGAAPVIYGATRSVAAQNRIAALGNSSITAGGFAAAVDFASIAGTILIGAQRTTADQLATITALTANNVIVSGQDVTVNLAVTETGESGFAAVAAALQAALQTRATLAEVTVAYQDGAFVVTAPLGVNISAGFSGSAAEALGLDAPSVTYVSFLDRVATALQAAIRAIPGLAAATVNVTDRGLIVSDSNSLNLVGPFDGPAAEALGLDEASALYAAGVPAESIAGAIARIRRLNPDWYWLVFDESVTGTEDAIAAAQTAAATPGMQAIIDSVEPGVLLPNEASSRAARISTLGSDRTTLVWSRTADYKSLAVAGGMSSINLDAVNSLKTAKFLTLTGTTPDAIDENAKRELDRKRVNHYSPFGPAPVFAEGWTPGGFIESRLWLDWMISRIQLDVFNLLRSTRRVGLTPQGQSEIYSVIVNACEAGRRNGGLAPRQVSEAMASDIRQATGTDFDGFLQRGYMIYTPPISALTQAQRDQRHMTPFRAWLAYTSFTHSLDIALNFES